MKNFILIFLLMGYSWFCYAQTITVTDIQTKNPMEGVVLISENPRVSTVTNTKGQTDISVFKYSEQVQVRSLGYKTLFLSYNQIENNGFGLQMEPSNITLDQVVVSATRWQQTSGNIPSKIVSVTSRDITLQNPQTAADLLGISGNVFIQKSQQGGGSPMIRGFATNRLIYSVDGVRMNNAIFRAGNLQNVINLDPFAIENTEVLFGPGSVIYGSDAIGGVMSFRTLTPQLSLSENMLVTGKAVTRYSSANKEKTGHVDVNIGWKKWALVTSFSSWDFDHLRQGSNGPDDYIKSIYPQRQGNQDVVITQEDPLLQVPSAYSQFNTMQKVRFKPNGQWDFQYGLHYSATSTYGRYDRHNRFKNGTIRYSEWNYGPQTWMMNNVSVSHQGSNAIYDGLDFRLTQQSFEESRIDRSLNSNERNTQTENVEAYSLNLDFTKSIGLKNTMYYGVEYVLNDVTSEGILTDITTGTDQYGPSRYPQSKWSSVAAYLNDEFRISDELSVQTGIRYNQFMLNADFSNNIDFYPLPFTNTEINNGALTGCIGGIYHPSGNWVLKANFGTAFRSPNVDDIGKVFDSEPGAVTIPNPGLGAEYAYNFDLGVTRIIGDFAKIDISGYYTVLKNALVRRDFRLNGQDSIVYDGIMSRVQAVQNAAVAHVYGVQVGLEVKLPAGFMFLSDLNYQTGKEELDDGSVSPSRHAAPLFGVSRLRYHYGGLTLEFNALYQGEKSYDDLAQEERSKDELYAKDADGNNYSPAWYTLNIKAIYKLNETFSVSGGVENLTDQRYRPYSCGISGAGRNVVLSLRADF